MKRRNFIELTGYGGLGLASSLWVNRSVAAVVNSELADLPTFDFTTIKVDRTGKERQRTYHRASLYSENLGNDRKSMPNTFKNTGIALRHENKLLLPM
jgi:hypothetical protein